MDNDVTKIKSDLAKLTNFAMHDNTASIQDRTLFQNFSTEITNQIIAPTDANGNVITDPTELDAYYCLSLFTDNVNSCLSDLKSLNAAW